MREEFVIVKNNVERNAETGNHAVSDMFGASAIHEIYGCGRPALIITLRVELSTVRQEEGENMGTFGDGVCTLTNQAYRILLNDPSLLQCLAVPALLKGLRDRNAAQGAMKFRNPKSIQEVAVTIK